jgi:copper chaperone CopZ
MSETTLKVEGMKCMHCKMSVEKALKEVPGVTEAQADVADHQVIVTGEADQAALAKAVEAAGYKVVH